MKEEIKFKAPSLRGGQTDRHGAEMTHFDRVAWESKLTAKGSHKGKEPVHYLSQHV